MSLTSTERAFLQRLVEAKPTNRDAGPAAVFFSNEYGIGKRAGRYVHYEERHFVHAAQLLRLNGLPTQALGSRASRAKAAQYGGMSEKSGTLAPHEGEIAVVAGPGCTLKGMPWTSPPGMCIVSTAEALNAVGCDVICIVENWEALKAIHEYRWIDVSSKGVLYVFRGDNKFSAAHVAELVDARPEPLWAFVDFDPAGLGIASGLPVDRLQKLVFPAWEWMAAASSNQRGRELFAQQEPQWGSTLDRAKARVVQVAWKALKEGRAGLTQERMLTAPGNGAQP